MTMTKGEGESVASCHEEVQRGKEKMCGLREGDESSQGKVWVTEGAVARGKGIARKGVHRGGSRRAEGGRC
ncbi:hypothetical protein GYH30_031194 [Glycine max]|nr:hypothetical protein GYH30_031194 [Glycine max]